jgi:hypothetical protein
MARFEIRDFPHSTGIAKIGIFDRKRSTYEREFDAKFTSRGAVEAVRDQLAAERANIWGTVVFREAIPTPKHPERQHVATRTGDIIAHDEQSVTVVDLGRNTITVPSAEVIEVAYGSVVHGVRPIRRGRHAGGVTSVPGDIAGWTAERHAELRYAVGNRSVAVWFAEFMLRYNIGTRHIDYDRVLARTAGKQAAMNAGPTASWLLEQWDDEHRS